MFLQLKPQNLFQLVNDQKERLLEMDTRNSVKVKDCQDDQNLQKKSQSDLLYRLKDSQYKLSNTEEYLENLTHEVEKVRLYKEGLIKNSKVVAENFYKSTSNYHHQIRDNFENG